MINNILPESPTYFDSKSFIKAIEEKIQEYGSNLKEVVLMDFSCLLQADKLIFKHNEREINIHYNPGCDSTKNFGSRIIIYTYSDQKEFAKREKEAEEKAYYKRLQESGIPENFWQKTFNDIEKREGLETSLKTIKKYLLNYPELRKNGTGLFMFGGVGSGKTLLMSLLGQILIKKGKRVVFYDTTDLFTTIKQSFNKESSLNEEEILKEILSADVFILDDLGAEKPTEWVLDKLFYIVNQRVTAQKPILITANYSQEELIERLGKKPRIISRLLGKSIIVENKASDYRPIEHKKNMTLFKEMD